MRDKLQKAIDLARKTGDRLIIYDSAKAQEAYVLMTLDQYEKIALGHQATSNLTEEELLDKINRDIAVWKNEQLERNITKISKEDFLSNFSEKGPDIIPDELMYYENINELEDNISPFQAPKEKTEEKRKQAKSHWGIPTDRKKAAEEVVENKENFINF